MNLSGSVSPILDYGNPPRAWIMRLIQSPTFLLGLILVIAFGLRWFRLDHESFWLDEFLAAQNSTGRGQSHMNFQRDVMIDPPPHLTRLSDGPGFWKIWTSLETDSHPPLHFLLLNIWRNIFGESDLAARALSVLLSVLSIVLLYDVARLLHGRTPALWAALLMALAGAQIQYAQEARNYTMLLALTLGACDALVRIEKFGPSALRASALGAYTLGMLLTHYLAAPAIVAIALYGIVRLRGSKLKVALTSFLVAALAFAACWGPFLLEQNQGMAREISAPVEQQGGSIKPDLQRLAMLPMRYFTEPMKDSHLIAQISAVMYLLPLLLLRRRPDLSLWCVLGGGVICWVFASDLIRSAHGLAYVRYTFLASAAAYALPAAMLWHMRGVFRHIVPLVLSVACIAAIAQPYTIHKADTRELARYVASHCGKDDILLVYTLAENDWWARALYLGVSHYNPPPCPVLFIGDPPLPDLDRRIRAARNIWIMSPTQTIPVEKIYPNAQGVEVMLFPYVGTIYRIVLP